MYAIVGGFVALALDFFNPSRKGSMCIMIEFPLSCHSSEDPDACKRGNKWTTPIGAIYQIGIPTVLSFLCIVVNLSKFTYYIWKEERMIVLMQESCMNKKAPEHNTNRECKRSQLRGSTKEVIDDMGLNCNTFNVDCVESEEDKNTPRYSLADEESFDSDQPYLFSEQRKQADEPRPQVVDFPSSSTADLQRTSEWNDQGQQEQEVRHDLAKRALVQSFLYIISFLLAYFTPLIGVFHRIIYKSRVPDWIFVVISIFSPLGGFFNVLIYTRPKIQSMRKLFPCYKNSSWIKLFFLVICNGGEVPDEIADEKVLDVQDTRSKILYGGNSRFIRQQQLRLEEEEQQVVGETELKQYDNLQNDTRGSENNDLMHVSAVSTNADELVNSEVGLSVSNNEGCEEESPPENEDSEEQTYYHYQIPPARFRTTDNKKKDETNPRKPVYISSSSIGLVSIPEGEPCAVDID